MPVNPTYQFRPPATRLGTNRVNTSGEAPASLRGKSSLRYANIVAAGKSLEIPAAGISFYFRVATAALDVRPSGGIFSPYVQGEGLVVDITNAFSKLEIKNNNSFSVVFEIFVGFDGFIDNKLILATDLYDSVVFPTYSAANSAASVEITDRSGTQITDINGGVWYAINRLFIYIFNPDTGVTLLLQESGSAVANGPAIAIVYPLTTLALPVNGDYSLNVGGGNINAIVSESYQCVAANTTPP